MAEQLRTNHQEVLRAFLGKVASGELPTTYDEYYELVHEGGVPRALSDFVIENGRPSPYMERQRRMDLRTKGWRISAYTEPLLEESTEYNYVALDRYRTRFGIKTGERDVVMFPITQGRGSMDSAVEDARGVHELYLPANAYSGFIEVYSELGDKPIYNGSTTGSIEAARARFEAPNVVSGFVRVAARVIDHFLQTAEAA